MDGAYIFKEKLAFFDISKIYILINLFELIYDRYITKSHRL